MTLNFFLRDFFVGPIVHNQFFFIQSSELKSKQTLNNDARTKLILTSKMSLTLTFLLYLRKTLCYDYFSSDCMGGLYGILKIF